MAPVTSSTEFRRTLQARGGARANRCFQCATCTSVCELSTPEHPFPRSQVLAAQWGLQGRLVGDPALWLCHQCHDCSVRCPRDVKPGDVMQVLRGMVVEKLAVPRFLGWVFGHVQWTWPLLIGLPILAWAAYLYGWTGLAVPIREHGLVYGDVVPHGAIYCWFFTLSGYLALVVGVSAWRFWRAMGAHDDRPPSDARAFCGALWPVLWEIATHKRFASCGAAKPRRWGHLALLWGFVGAAVTSAFLIVVMYGFHMELPLPQSHWIKLLGNFSAVLLVFGCGSLIYYRVKDGITSDVAGTSNPLDVFFLAVVTTVVATGVVIEIGRYVLHAQVAAALYVVHLGAVTCLFLTIPYSKFAHLVYRTLALVHERLVQRDRRAAARAPTEG